MLELELTFAELECKLRQKEKEKNCGIDRLGITFFFQAPRGPVRLVHVSQPPGSPHREHRGLHVDRQRPREPGLGQSDPRLQGRRGRQGQFGG